jgi:hypothetical protein
MDERIFDASARRRKNEPDFPAVIQNFVLLPLLSSLPASHA